MKNGEPVYSVSEKGVITEHKTLLPISDDLYVSFNHWSYTATYKQPDGTWKHVWGEDIVILYPTRGEAIDQAIVRRQAASLRYKKEMDANRRELKKLLSEQARV